jgi:hypothetical protein
VRKQGTNAAVDIFSISGISASPSNAQVQAFINTQNPMGGGTDIISGSNLRQLLAALNNQSRSDRWQNRTWARSSS